MLQAFNERPYLPDTAKVKRKREKV